MNFNQHFCRLTTISNRNKPKCATMQSCVLHKGKGNVIKVKREEQAWIMKFILSQ